MPEKSVSRKMSNQIVTLYLMIYMKKCLFEERRIYRVRNWVDVLRKPPPVSYSTHTRGIEMSHNIGDLVVPKSSLLGSQ